MSLPPATYRLLNYRPPQAGAPAIQAQPPSLPAGGTMQESLQTVIGSVQSQAMRLIDQWRPTQPTAPAPAPGQTTPLTPEQMQQNIARLQKELTALQQQIESLIKALDQQQQPPAPKPAPQPEAPKPAPKPEAPKPAPKPSAGPGGTYTVKKGDSLSKIAQAVLGDANRWREIYELNKDQIANPNVIRSGMVLKLPGGAKPAPKPAPKPATYTVQRGDSLSAIAQRVLGDMNRWREIFELNRDKIANPNAIVAGMVLKLPGGAKGVAPAPAPSTPAPGPAKGSAHARRHDWFITQYRTRYNPNEDVPGSDNGNCGPTSLTMVAKAFGKINPSAAQADAAIEESRRRMGDGMNERSGTSVAGIARGAQSYGLDAKIRWDASLTTIQQELSKGRLPIVHLGTYHLWGRRGGGHYTVVTAIQDGKVYLNDPAWKDGPLVISTAKFMESIRDRGTYAMISVGR